MVLKQQILTVSALGGCGNFEITYFNSFFFGRVWWSGKNSFLIVSTLRECSGLEITDFNSFCFGRVWWP